MGRSFRDERGHLLGAVSDDDLRELVANGHRSRKWIRKSNLFLLMAIVAASIGFMALWTRKVPLGFVGNFLRKPVQFDENFGPVADPSAPFDPQVPGERAPGAQEEHRLQKGRLGSFLVIGDWGWDRYAHGNLYSSRCQKAIGDKMKQKMEELGDVKFIINVGDSFYPNGVKSKDDPQWDEKWRKVYPATVRNVPWYSVYGNHDYHLDPGACSSDPNAGAQLNDDESDLDHFYMPGYSWFKELSDLNVEVVGMDTNKFMNGWKHQLGFENQTYSDCQWTPCKAKCHQTVENRTAVAFKLFGERMEQSTAKHMLVFSHYPTDYFSSAPEFIANLSKNDSGRTITYFGGHRHNTDTTSTFSTGSNKNWCVGGGGGWSCDGRDQGFVVGEISEDGVHTYSSLVDWWLCCPSEGEKSEPEAPDDELVDDDSSENLQEPLSEAEAEKLEVTKEERTEEPLQRIGSFLVIGDWGWDPDSHGNLYDRGCQRAIGDEMDRKMKELGDVKFIINVGDSFYPNGLYGKDDPQWDRKWRNVYSDRLRSVPWYSVYGNHDYHVDPCICNASASSCAQVNSNISDLDRFYMPSYNWFHEHPELGLEVVGLDLNKFQDGWKHDLALDDLHFSDCQWTSCNKTCRNLTETRSQEAFELFGERVGESKAKNLVVFSHYPTDYFSAVPEFVHNLSRTDNGRKITYFGGHRHNTDLVTTFSTHPNMNWCVGGGGGWSCDGKEQGFVVGEIGLDYMLTTYAELIDYRLCCPK